MGKIEIKKIKCLTPLPWSEGALKTKMLEHTTTLFKKEKGKNNQGLISWSETTTVEFLTLRRVCWSSQTLWIYIETPQEMLLTALIKHLQLVWHFNLRFAKSQ